jgi:hypothetical protein
MALIQFSKTSYRQYQVCPIDTLEEEVSRTSIRLKLHNQPQTDHERQSYQQELDRLTALRYISQLRKGKISPEEFGLKVKLVETVQE